MTAASVTAARSPLLWRFMAAWFERFLRRNLNGLRIARWSEPSRLPPGPLIVYSNHPGWWDAAVYILLAARLFPDRQSYAPIDAAMLEKYRIFARLGAFGIDLASPRGAAAFLRASAEVLGAPDRALWITAQGRFADSRERPLGLRAGVARLAEMAPGACFLPLAIEYAFWTERGAEALVAFGEPRPADALLPLARAERLRRLEDDLAATMDRLAADVIARDRSRFRPVVEGRAGVGGIYDLGRRLNAKLQGRSFDPAHRGPAT